MPFFLIYEMIFTHAWAFRYVSFDLWYVLLFIYLFFLSNANNIYIRNMYNRYATSKNMHIIYTPSMTSNFQSHEGMDKPKT